MARSETKLYVVAGTDAEATARVAEEIHERAKAIINATDLRYRTRELHAEIAATRGRTELLQFLREQVKIWAELESCK